MVDALGQGVAVEHVFVLRPHRGDEVVDPRHLDHGEECDEEEPGGQDLLHGRAAMQCAPDATDAFLLLFFRLLLGSGFAEEGCRLRDHAFSMLAPSCRFRGVGVGGIALLVLFLGLRDELADGLVRIRRHYENLYD